jgi:hypothetical protein
MALLDDVFSGWGTTVLIGVVALAVPAFLPAVGEVIGPVAKGLVVDLYCRLVARNCR